MYQLDMPTVYKLYCIYLPVGNTKCSRFVLAMCWMWCQYAWYKYV